MPSDLTPRVAKATAAALAVVALAVGIWQVRSVLILLLLALTLAAAIRPGVEWLNRHRVPQSVGILLHFLVVGGAVALFLWLAVPPALHQIGHALGGGPVRTAAGRTSGRRSASRPSSPFCRSQLWECCSAAWRLSSRSRSPPQLRRS